jgi:hypothetical protein
MFSIPAGELGRRRIAWGALCDLFLDTELTDADFDRIARQLRDTQYSVEQLEDILRNELAPLLYTNCAPGHFGEWAAFDVAAIEREILAGKHLHIRRWTHFLRRRTCRNVLRSIIAPDWKQITARLRPGGMGQRS